MHCIFYAFILSSRQKIGTTNSKKLLYTMAVFFNSQKGLTFGKCQKLQRNGERNRTKRNAFLQSIQTNWNKTNEKCLL